MSSNNEKVYYAVGRGREVGIYDTWKECKAQVDGFNSAKYRKFFSIEEAQEFVNFWKNYESPHDSNESTPVSNRFNGKANQDDRRKRYNKSASMHSEPEYHYLGREKKNCNRIKSSLESYKTPYTSPISTSLRYSEYYTSGFSHKQGYSNGNDGFNYRKPNISLNSIKTPETDFHFSYPKGREQSRNSSQQSTNTPNGNGCATDIFPSSGQSESVSSEKKNSEIVVKKEVIEVDESSELGVSDKLTMCLGMLESTVKIITSQNTNDSKKLKKSLKLFLNKLFNSTNNGVNPQMDAEETVDKNEESGNCDNGIGMQSSTTAVETESVLTPKLQSSLVTPVKTTESPSSHLSTSFEGRYDLKNVDVLALSLRLDSFEKRFDACLKEVGAIVSEMSNIKTEIKEIKNALGSDSGYTPKRSRKVVSSSTNSDSGYSPGGKGKMFQSTLSFGSSTKSEGSKSNYSSPARSYSTKKDEPDSGEPERKKSKSLKRKLSWGSSSSKQDDEGNDDIFSRIKMEQVDYTSFVVDSDEYVEVYTDGACHSNGTKDARAGIGIYFGDSHPLNVSEPVDGPPTNNSAEIQAARVAIELATKAGVPRLKICTDSEFLINCVTKWMHRWKKNGWTLVNGGQVKNRKELEKLDKAAANISVRWEKVEAHSGIKGNEMADRLANAGAAKYKR